MPKLEELNPELIPVFSRNIDLLKRQYRFYQWQMEELKSSLLAEEGEMLRISIDKLCKCEDPALVLFEILKDDGFNASEVEQILDSVKPGLQHYRYYDECDAEDKRKIQLLVLVEDDHGDNNAVNWLKIVCEVDCESVNLL